MRTVDIEVLHGAEHPSVLVLPEVIAAREAPAQA
jgi:hypothetical protein